MGEGINGNNEINIREVDKQSGGRTGTDTKSKSTGDTGTTGGRTGGRTGGGRTGGSTGNEKEVVSSMAMVDEEERKRLERNAKRRERYQKQKESGELNKPKKVNTKKKKNEPDVINNEQLNGLIMSLSVIVASRPNCQHWLLSESEVNSITTPLCNILKESEVFSKVGEHSNSIALIFACLTVFTPRIIKTVTLMNEQRKVEKNVRKQPKQFATDKNKDITANRNDDKRLATDGKNTRSDEYWLGQGLY